MGPAKLPGHARFLSVFLYIILLFSVVSGQAAPNLGSGSSGTIETSQVVKAVLTFDNTGTGTGYFPFVDLILPPGVSVVGAKVSGVVSTVTTQAFDSGGGCVAHPVAKNQSVVAEEVCGESGANVATITLPLLSVYPDQSPVSIEVELTSSSAGTFPLQSRAGFGYGNTPEDDAATDPSVTSSWSPGYVLTVTPPPTPDPVASITASVVYDGETSVYPVVGTTYTATVTVDLAAATYNGTTITITVPPQLAYQGILITKPASGVTVSSQPAIGATELTSPAADVVLSLVSITGSDAVTDEIQAVLSYSIPVDSAAGTANVVPHEATDKTATLQVVAAATSPVETDTATAVLTMLSRVEMTTTHDVVYDTGATGCTCCPACCDDPASATCLKRVTPGDVVEYSISVTGITEYVKYGTLNIVTYISDGQSFDHAYTPKLDYEGLSAGTGTLDFVVNNTATLNLDEIGNDNDPTTDGSTRITFAVSTLLIFNGVSVDGKIQGGGAADPGSFTIRFYAKQMDKYTDYVDPTGALTYGHVQNNEALTATSTLTMTVFRTSGASLGPIPSTTSVGTVKRDGGKLIDLSIYAKEFVPCASQPCDNYVQPNMIVTFRVRYQLPTTDVTSLRLTHYQPYPILNALDVISGKLFKGAAPPPLDRHRAHENDEYWDRFNLKPDLDSKAKNNKFVIWYQNNIRGPDTVNMPLLIDILYTQRIADLPQLQDSDTYLVLFDAIEGKENEKSGSHIQSSSLPLIISNPEITLIKGVVASSNTEAVFEPIPQAGYEFAAPGTSCTAVPTLHHAANISDGITALESAISNIDAEDTVTIALTLTNTGTSSGFQVVIQDKIPRNFQIPIEGLNLCVRDGRGNELQFLPVAPNQGNNNTAIFGEGIRIFAQSKADTTPIDTCHSDGVLGTRDADPGANVVIVTYNLVSNMSFVTGDELVMPAQLTNYTGVCGGRDHARPPVVIANQDPLVTVAEPVLEFVPSGLSSVVLTTLARLNDTRPDMTILERSTLNVTVTVAEGTSPGYLITVVLAEGMTYLNSTVLEISSNINPTPLKVGSAGTYFDSNRTVHFHFGDIVNVADNDFPDNIRVSVEFEIADDDSVNTNTAELTTRAGVQTSLTSSTQDLVIEVVEPLLEWTFSSNVTQYDALDAVKFIATLQHKTESNAPGFDVYLSDFFQPELIYVPGSAKVVVSDGSEYTIEQGASGSNDTTWRVYVPVLELGQTVTVTYEAVVAQLANPGDIKHEYNATWDSLPLTNFTGRPYEELDDYTTRLVPPSWAEFKILRSTVVETDALAHDENKTDLALGEMVVLYADIVLSEASYDIPVNLTIELPTADKIQVVGSRVVFIGGNIQGSALPAINSSAEHIDSDGDGVLDQAVFRFGSFVEVADNGVTKNDSIIVEVVAHVLEEGANVNGDTAQFIVKLDINPDVPVTPTTVDVDLVEPELLLTKNVDIKIGDAGDNITYSVTVVHASPGIGTYASAAYDVNITDILDPLLILYPGSTNVVIDTGTNYTVLNGAGDGDRKIMVTIPTLHDTDTVTLTYTVMLNQSVAPNQELDNTAVLDCHSAPQFLSQPIADYVSTLEAVPRPYEDKASQQVVVHKPRIEMDISTTSLDLTTSEYYDASLGDVTLGELITYNITVTLPESTSDPTLTVTLPHTNGIATVFSSRVVRIGDDITVTPNTVGISHTDAQLGDGLLDSVVFDLGSVINSYTNQETRGDEIEVEVVAVIALHSANVRGDVLNATAVLEYTRGSVEDNVYTEIVEPELEILKEANITRGDSGDGEFFTLTVQHTASSNAPAFDLNITDALNSYFVLEAGSVNHTGNSTIVSDSNNLVRVHTPTLLLGEVLVITFSARLNDTVRSGIDAVNRAELEYDSYPAPEPAHPGRVQTDDAEWAVDIVPPDVRIHVNGTSLRETTADKYNPELYDLTIHEIVSYRFNARIPEGTNRVVMTIDLPFSLGLFKAVNATILHIGDHISIPSGYPQIIYNDTQRDDGVDDQVKFDFGVLFNSYDNVDTRDDEIEIEVMARVEDVVRNARGRVPVARGTLDYAQDQLTDEVEVNIVEPELQITKDANITIGDAGDGELFTVEISHTSESNSAAFDVNVTDILSSYFVFDNSTINVTAGGNVTNIDTSRGSGNTLLVYIPTLLLGESVMIQYVAMLNDSVRSGLPATNLATVDYDSYPLEGPGRQYEEEIEYSTDILLPEMELSVNYTNLNQTTKVEHDPEVFDLNIHEEVTYHATARLAEGTNRVIFKVDLPSVDGKFSVVGYEVLFVGANIEYLDQPSGPTIEVKDEPVADGINEEVSFDFGTVLNHWDNMETMDDLITVKVIGFVEDHENNENGDAFNTTGILDYEQGEAKGTVLVEITEPELEIAKVANITEGDAGDAIIYTITVEHTEDSTSEAFNVNVTDTLSDLFIVYNTTFNITTYPENATVEIRRNWDGKVHLYMDEFYRGEILVFELVVRLNNTVGYPTATADNDGHVDWDSMPGMGPLGRYDEHEDKVEIKVLREPRVTIDIISTSVNLTESDRYDGDIVDLAIYEEFELNITITLYEGRSNLVMALQLPSGATGELEVVDASVTHIGSSIVLENSTIVAEGSPGLWTSRGGVAEVLDTATFTFGELVNYYDNEENEGDMITFYARIRVPDVVANAGSGDPLTVNANLDWTTNKFDTPVDVEIVEPQLVIEKSINSTTGDGADTYLYTVTLSHGENSQAAAYEVNITDFIPDDLTLISGTVKLVPVEIANIIYGNEVDAVNVTGKGRLLKLGEQINITYEATLNASIPSGVYVINRAVATYYGHPNFGRDYEKDVTASILTDVPRCNLTVINSTIPETSLAMYNTSRLDIGIGERVGLRLVCSLPEGYSDLKYVIDVKYGLTTMEIVSSTFTTHGNLVSSTMTTGSSGVHSDTDSDGLDDRVVFDFGSTLNQPDNEQNDADTVVADIIAELADTGANKNGEAIRAVASAFFGSTILPAVQDDLYMDIVEPELNLAFAGDITSGDGGDIATYTVTIQVPDGPCPSSCMAIFDVRLEDALRPYLNLVANSISIDNSTGSASPIIVVDDTNMIVTIPTLNMGELVTIEYQARINETVTPTSVLKNEVNITWDSHPLARGRRYTTDASHEIVVTTPNITRFEVTNSSIHENTISQHDGSAFDVAVVETVTFTIDIQLHEGYSDPVFKLQLPVTPGKMRVISSEIVKFGSQLTGPGLIVGASANHTNLIGSDDITETVIFDLGEIANDPDNVEDEGDIVTLQVTARLLDTPGNVDSVGLTVNGQLFYVADDSSLFYLQQVSLDVIEPQIEAVLTANVTSGDAGDPIRYTLMIRHKPGSTSSAFDFNITSALDFLYQAPVLSMNATADSKSSVTLENVTYIVQFLVPSLPLGQGPYYLYYDVVLGNDVLAGTTETTSAYVSYDSHPFTGGRHASTTSNDFDVKIPLAFPIEVRFLNSSIPQTVSSEYDPDFPDVGIKERIKLQLRTRLVEGRNELHRLTVAFPAIIGTISINSAIVSHVGGNIDGLTFPVPSPANVTNQHNPDDWDDFLEFDLGFARNNWDNLITDDDYVFFEVEGTVEDVTNNTAGLLFKIESKLYSSAGRSKSLEWLEAVEPALLVEKTSTFTKADAGDIIPYTVTVSHDTYSSAPAFNVSVRDLMHPNIPLMPGTVNVTGKPSSLVENGDGSFTVIVEELYIGESFVVTYNGKMATPVGYNTSYMENEAELRYLSHPGDGRVYTSSDTHRIASDSEPGFRLVYVSSTLDETGKHLLNENVTDSMVKEIHIFDIELSLAEGLSNIHTIVQNPNGMTLLNATVFYVGGQLSSQGYEEVLNVSYAGFRNSSNGNAIHFDFGDVFNTPDNLVDAQDEIIIRVFAEMDDTPSQTVQGFETEVVAEVFFLTSTEGLGRLERSHPLEVAEFALVSDKFLNATTGDAGDPILITFLIKHTATSIGPAYDVDVIENLHEHLVLVPGTVQSTANNSIFLSGNSANDTKVLVRTPVLPNGETVIVTYIARISDTAPAASEIKHTISQGARSHPENGRPQGSSDFSPWIVTNKPTCTFTWTSTSLAHTGFDEIETDRLDLAVGEQVYLEGECVLTEGSTKLYWTVQLPKLGNDRPPAVAKKVDVEWDVEDGSTLTGSWGVTTFFSGYHNSGYHHDFKKGAKAPWKYIRYDVPPSELPHTLYEIFYWQVWNAFNYCSKQPIQIYHDGIWDTRYVNLQTAGVGKTYHSLGVFEFNRQGGDFVRISNQNCDGYALADNIRWVSQTVPGGTFVASAVVTAFGNQMTSTGNLTLNAEGVYQDTDGDDIADLAIFDFGTVVNLPNNVNDSNDVVRIKVASEVPPHKYNVAGVILPHSSKLTFGNVNIGDVDWADNFEVVNTDGTASKTGDVVSGDAGDVVNYEITISISADATVEAFDISVLDPMPTYWNVNSSSLSMTPSVAGTTMSFNETDGLRVSITSLDRGAEVTIKYSTTLDEAVTPGLEVVNHAVARFDSHLAERGQEFLFNINHTVTIRHPELVSFTLLPGDLTTTHPKQFHSSAQDMAIGERVTLKARVRLIEGTTNTTLMLDVPALSHRLHIAGAPRISYQGGNLTLSSMTPTLTNAKAGDAWNEQALARFGWIINTPTNVVDEGDELEVEFDVLMVNTPGNIQGEEISSIKLTFDWGTGSDELELSLDVVEPVLVLESNDDSDVDDAGDVLSITGVLAHNVNTSSAWAYDIVFVHKYEWALSVQDIVLSGADATAIVTPSNDTHHGVVVTISVPLLRLDENVTFAFTYRLNNTVESNTTYTTTPELTWYSFTNDSRRYTNLADDQGTHVPVLAQVPTFSVVDTSLDATGSSMYNSTITDLAPGESATVRLDIEFLEGIIHELNISVVAGSGSGALRIDGASLSSGNLRQLSGAALPGPVIAGDVIVLDLGSVVNEWDNVESALDHLVLEFNVTLVATGNPFVSGEVVSVAASAVTRHQSWAGTSSFEIVTNEIDVDVSATPLSGDAGDVLAYTLVFGHGSNSSAPLYDVSVTSTLDSHETLVAGSLVVSSGDVQVVSGNTTGDSAVSLKLGVLAAPPTSPITVTFSTVIATTAALQVSQLEHYASAWASSAPTLAASTTAHDSHNTTVLAGALDFNVTVTATSRTDTGSSFHNAAFPDLAIGESVTFLVQALFREGQNNASFVFDIGAAGNVNITDVVLGAVSPGLDLSGADVDLVDSNGDGLTDRVIVDTNTFVNNGDNNVDANDIASLSLTVVTLDSTANTDGRVVEFDAVLVDSGSSQRLRASAFAEIVVPALNISSSLDRTTDLDAGDIVTRTTTIAWNETATAPALNITILDNLGPHLLVAPGSITSNVALSVVAGNSTGSSLIHLVIASLPQGVTAVIQYGLVLNSSVGHSVSQVATSQNVIHGGKTLTFADTLHIVSNITSFSLAVNTTTSAGSGFYDPAVPDMAIGDTACYLATTALRHGTNPLHVRVSTTSTKLFITSATVVSLGPGVSDAVSEGDAVTPSGGSPPTVAEFNLGVVTVVGPQPTADVGHVVVRVCTEVSAEDVASANVTAVLTSGGTVVSTRIAGVEFVTPVLTATLVSTPALLVGDAGDEVVLTLDIKHTSASSAAALDIAVARVVHGDAQVLSTNATATVGNITVAGHTMSAAAASLALGTTMTVSYRMRLNETVEYDTGSLQEQLTITWKSSTGSDGITFNVTVQDVFAKVALAGVNITHAFSGSSLRSPSLEQVSVGEVVTVIARIVLPEGSNSITVSASAPTDRASVQDAVVSSIGSSISYVDYDAGSLTTGSSISGLTSTGGTKTSSSIGIVNTGNNLNSGGDAFEVAWRVLILNNAANVAGSKIELTVGATSHSGSHTVSSAMNVTVIEPVLSFSKAANVTTVYTDFSGNDVSSPIKYNITVSNTSPQDAAAFNVSISDNLETQGLVFIPGTLETSTQPLSVIEDSTDGLLNVTVPVLQKDQGFWVSFIATGNSSHGNISNTALGKWRSGPGVVYRGHGPISDSVDIFVSSVLLTTFVADDPTDAQVGISDGDTVTLNFGIPTNQGAISTKEDILKSFSFSEKIGSNFTAVWTSSTTLVITIVNATGSTATLGATTVTALTSGPVKLANGDPLPSGQTSYKLSGDFGYSPMPRILSFSADDPDDADITYTKNDTFTITFSEPTNGPNIATASAINSVFKFSQGGSSITLSGVIGSWTNDNTVAVIQVVDASATSPRPVIGSFQVSVSGNQLTNKYGNSSVHHTRTGVLTGNWGIVSINPPVLQSFVADDPNNGDNVFNAGDTLTLSFNVPTNKPDVSTPAAFYNVFKIALLNDPSNTQSPLGTNFTAVWNNDGTALTLTFASVPSCVPAKCPSIGNVTVSVIGTVKTANEFSAGAGSNPVTLSGSFGQLPGPQITSVTAGDPDDLDAVFSDGDTILIQFDADTNQPAVGTKSEIDALISSSKKLGESYTGTWINARTLSITIKISNSCPAAVTNPGSALKAGCVTGIGASDLRYCLGGPGASCRDTCAANNGTCAPWPESKWLSTNTQDEALKAMQHFGVCKTNIASATRSARHHPSFDTEISECQGYSVAGDTADVLKPSTSWTCDDSSQMAVRLCPCTSVCNEIEIPNFWNLDLSPVDSSGLPTLSLVPGSTLRDAAGVSLSPYGSFKTTISGDWGQKAGPGLKTVVAAGAVGATDMVYNSGDTITIEFTEPTSQPVVATKGDLDKFLSFIYSPTSQPSRRARILSLLQNTPALNPGDKVSLGQNYKGVWVSASTLRIDILDSTGSSPELKDPRQLLARVRGHVQVATKDSLPTSTSGRLTGNWGMQPGPLISALIASDPDNGDNIFSEGDTITVVYANGTNTPPGATKEDIDALYMMSHPIGVNYTGRWSNTTSHIITLLNVTGISAPPLSVFKLTVKASAHLKMTFDLSLDSTPTSPPLSGDWGNLANRPGAVTGDTGRLNNEGCKTFWCLWWWLLVGAGMLTVTGCILVIIGCSKIEKEEHVQIPRERSAEAMPQLKKVTVQSAAEAEARAESPTTRREELPTLPMLVKQKPSPVSAKGLETITDKPARKKEGLSQAQAKQIARINEANTPVTPPPGSQKRALADPALPPGPVSVPPPGSKLSLNTKSKNPTPMLGALRKKKQLPNMRTTMRIKMGLDPNPSGKTLYGGPRPAKWPSNAPPPIPDEGNASKDPSADKDKQPGDQP